MSTALIFAASPPIASSTASLTSSALTAFTDIFVPSGSAPSGASTDTETPPALPEKLLAGYFVSSSASSLRLSSGPSTAAGSSATGSSDSSAEAGSVASGASSSAVVSASVAGSSAAGAGSGAGAGSETFSGAGAGAGSSCTTATSSLLSSANAILGDGI